MLNTLLSVEGKVQGSCGGEKMPSVAVCASCLCPVTSNAGWKEGAMPTNLAKVLKGENAKCWESCLANVTSAA